MEDADVSLLVGSSTDALISPDVHHSTGSLVNKDLEELLGKHEAAIFPSSGNLEDQSAMGQSGNMFNEIFQQYIDANKISEQIYGNVENPMLLKLYNIIQVFLLRHGLSLDFLIVFQRYVNLLKEADMDPLQDKYLLTIQNELSKGYEFSPILQDIISTFLLKPENYIMKLAYFQFKSEKLLMKRMFSGWELKWSLSYNLNELEVIWRQFLKKKYYLRWNDTMVLKTKQWVRDSDKMYEEKLSGTVLHNWASSLQQLNTKAKIADNFFLDNVFDVLKQKYERLRVSSKDVGVLRSRNLSRLYFNKWKLKLCEKHFIPQGTKSLLLNKYFDHFKIKHNHITYLIELSRFSERNITLRGIVSNWKQITKKKEGEMAALLTKSDLFFKRRFFNTLKGAYNMMEIESKVKQSNFHSLEAFFLQTWIKRFNENIKYSGYTEKHNTIIQRSYFEFWESLSKSYNSANLQYTLKLKIITINSVRLKSRECLVVHKAKKEKIGFCFALWKRKLELNKMESYYSKQIRNKFWKKFKQRHDSMRDLRRVTDKCYEGEIKKHHFTSWQTKIKQYDTLNQKADVFIKLRFITLMKRSIKEAQMRSRISLDFLKETDRSLIDTIWKVWRKNLDGRRLLNLEILMDKYLIRKSKALKEKLLTKWIERCNFYRTDSIEIADKTFDIHQLKLFFMKWNNKRSIINLMEKESMEIHQNMIESSAFDAWIRKLEDLRSQESKLLLYVEEKQVKLLMKWTNKWSVKVLKLRRNEEVVDMFRTRWNRANLRAILSLWREKALADSS